jgi:hypothetical protein
MQRQKSRNEPLEVKQNSAARKIQATFKGIERNVPSIPTNNVGPSTANGSNMPSNTGDDNGPGIPYDKVTSSSSMPSHTGVYFTPQDHTKTGFLDSDQYNEDYKWGGVLSTRPDFSESQEEYE